MLKIGAKLIFRSTDYVFDGATEITRRLSEPTSHQLLWPHET